MIVKRSLTLNPVEPGILSFRAASGIETKLDLTYYGVSGNLFGDDLTAQLQLTGRTDDRTATYMVPATDVVNGRARAVLPTGAIVDPNGYRLRLVGSLLGEPALLAIGTVIPVDAAGLIETPIDTVDAIDLALQYDEEADITVTLWQDSSGGTPYDLTDENTIITATLYDQKNGSMIMPFTVTVLSANEVGLSLTVEQVNTLPAACWWNLQASTAGGLTTLCEGNVTTTGTITPPLVDTTANYDYQKPNDADPVAGQIVHGNFTQNTLKVAKLDHDGLDQTAMLKLIAVGDNIVIGATTWTVTLSIENSAFFAFSVQPVQQAVVTGVTAVTFRRPVSG